jgi:nucleotide-binding universal stress UspA family protein
MFADSESLIVSGTSGMHNFTSKLMGSVTQEIFNQLPSSLLIIPANFEFTSFKRICFATDLMSPLKWDVEELLELSKKWEAHISFFSVLDESKLIDVEVIGDSFVHHYLKDLKYAYTSFHLNQADSAVQGIRKFVHDDKSDLLVLTHKDRTFWAGLFEKSVSGEFLANTEIPVLIFHQEVDK